MEDKLIPSIKFLISEDNKNVELHVNNKLCDTHFNSDDQEELDKRKASMLFNKFRWTSIYQATEISVIEMCKKVYFTAGNGEIMEQDYLRFQRPTTATEDWNTTLSVRTGYTYYLKCKAAGFHSNVAATMSFAASYLDNMQDNERTEIMNILNLKKTHSY